MNPVTVKPVNPSQPGSQAVNGNQRVYLDRVRTVTRTIAATADYDNGVWPSAEVDMYLSGFINDGWTLLNTHFIGMTPSGATFAWILVR